MTVTYRDTKGAKVSNAEQDSSLRSLNWRHGGTLPSQSSVSLTNEYNYFDISGSTNISTFSKSSVEAGFLVRITFTSAGGMLVYQSDSFILPGSASITWAAGDTAVFVNLDAGGNWKCIDYTLHSLAPSAQVNATALTSSLIPAVGFSYDLGSTAFNFRNLYIDGIAYFEWIKLASGQIANKISFDPTMTDNSGNSLVTERAVKGYVDTIGAHAYGRVTADGTEGNGYNFTSVKNSTGYYTITLTTAASATNFNVVASYEASSVPHSLAVNPTSTNTFDVRVWKINAGFSAWELDDQTFHFAVFDNDQGL